MNQFIPPPVIYNDSDPAKMVADLVLNLSNQLANYFPAIDPTLTPKAEYLDGTCSIAIVQASTNKTASVNQIRGVFLDPSIKIASGNIPSIAAGVRSLVTVDLGSLHNKTNALIGFFSSTAMDSSISLISRIFIGRNNDLPALQDGLTIAGQYNFCINTLIQLPNNSFVVPTNMLRVTSNYLKTAREWWISSGNAEQYNTNSYLVRGISSYENIGAGVLVGWYGALNTGFLGLDKKVQCESAWLTQLDSSTILNIALKNVDSTPNASLGFKVAIYE